MQKIKLRTSLFYTSTFRFVPKVSGNDKSNRKIVIEFNVTIRDHPELANDSKHWVGAGMRSGYQMLWVGQEALYVYKVGDALSFPFNLKGLCHENMTDFYFSECDRPG